MPGRRYALPVVLLPLPSCGEFSAEHNVWRSVSVWGNGVRAASPCYPEVITVPIYEGRQDRAVVLRAGRGLVV